jgi:hypothetical protein
MGIPFRPDAIEAAVSILCDGGNPPSIIGEAVGVVSVSLVGPGIWSAQLGPPGQFPAGADVLLLVQMRSPGLAIVFQSGAYLDASGRIDVAVYDQNGAPAALYAGAIDIILLRIGAI